MKVQDFVDQAKWQLSFFLSFRGFGLERRVQVYDLEKDLERTSSRLGKLSQNSLITTTPKICYVRCNLPRTLPQRRPTPVATLATKPPEIGPAALAGTCGPSLGERRDDQPLRDDERKGTDGPCQGAAPPNNALRNAMPQTTASLARAAAC